MSICIKFYGGVLNAEKSRLKRELIKMYGNEPTLDDYGTVVKRGKADIIYDTVIRQDSNLESSFINYLINKSGGNINEIQTYDNEGVKEPSLAEYLNWLDYLKNYNLVNKKFSVNTFQTSTPEFLELAEGMNILLIDTLYKEGLTPNDLFNANKTVAINNIRNKSIQRLIDTIKENHAISQSRADDMVYHLNFYRQEFWDTYLQYLASEFDIEINRNGSNLEVTAKDTLTTLSDSIEMVEEKETKDSAFDKNSFEFDSKNGAAPAIKLLLSSLPQRTKNGKVVRGELGVYKPVNYTEAFNLVQQKLVTVPPDINLQTAELSRWVSQYPYLGGLLKRINFGDTYIPGKTNYNKEQQLRTQFVNQFSKAQNKFITIVQESDGTVRFVDSNLDSIQRTIVSEWQTNFETMIATGRDLKAEASVAFRAGDKKKFLQSLGIEIKNASRIPNSLINKINDYGLKEGDDVFQSLYQTGASGIRGSLIELAGYSLQERDDIIDFQHLNAEGNMVYGITLNNYLSTIARDLAYYAGDEDSLQYHYPELFSDPYATNSKWLAKILDGSKIKIGIFESLKFTQGSNSNISPVKELKGKDLNVLRMISILNEGAYPFIRSADRGVEYFIYFNNDKSLLVESRAEAITYLVDHLKAEIASMMSSENIVHYEKNNKDFRVFKDRDGKSLLSYIDKDPETALLMLSEMDSLIDNEIVFRFINAKVDEIINEEKEFLTRTGVLEQDGRNKYKYIAPLIEKYKNVDNVVELFALNSFISVIEQSKLFVGDFAFYKNASDIFKRMSMMNSTKETARVDDEINNYLSSITHGFSERLGVEKGRVDSTIRTVTINDVVSGVADYNSYFADTLKKAFGDDYNKYKKVYDNMTEGDGFAYMTYDEYRIASIRFGEWEGRDQELYDRILNGEKEMEAEVIRRATVKKYQYTGKLFHERLNIPAGRKFSVIPLIPTALDPGSALYDLNEQMLSNDIGMAFFESAAKFGHSTFVNEIGEKGAHQFYDKNGKYVLDLKQGTVDLLDYKYMGNQLKIHNDPKGSITASVQKRKLAMSNLYQNGEILTEFDIEGEPTLKSLVDEYVNLQSDIVNTASEKLPNPEKDIDAFVNSIIDLGLLQGYSTNELKSLTFLKELKIIDALPNKNRIQNLILSKLRKGVISNKRFGDALAQVPDIGLEITEQVSDNASRHNLKFYRYAKDGRLLPMEIMTALPSELIDYVKDKYGNGKLTQKALDAFNRDIEADNKLYEETGVMTELTRATLYAGFRIPNQGASSSDAAKVKKFLPPYMGAATIVPKQIVAKTGSDFDIDKLNLYKPIITLKREKIKGLVNEFFEGTSKEALIEILKDETKGIEFESKSRSELIKEVEDLVLNVPASYGIGTQLKEAFRRFSHNRKANAKVTSLEVKMEGTEAEAKENRLLSVELAITLHPANHKQLLSPIIDLNHESSIMGNITKKVRQWRGESTTKTDALIDVYKNWKNVEKFVDFLAGKAGVGQVAVHITNHALAQKANLKMKAVHNYFGNSNEWIELGRIKNDAGNTISEVLSEMLTAYVDIAKDPKVLDINAVNDTANTILMMLRWGLSPDMVFAFINQPIIRDYIVQKALNNSVINTADRLPKDGVVANVIKRQGYGHDITKMIYFIENKIEEGDEKFTRPGKIYNDFTLQSLIDNIKKPTKDIQIQSLDLLLEYERQSRIFQKMIRATSPDTQRFKTLSTIENQLKLRDEVMETEMFDNFDKMFSTSFIKDYHAAKEKYFNSVKNLFLSQHKAYKADLDKLKEFTTRKVFDSNQEEKLINKIENEFFRYVLQKLKRSNGRPFIDYKKSITNLLQGSQSIPKIVRELKKYGYDNPLIDNLIPVIKEDLDNLKIKNKRLTANERELIIAGARTLARHASVIDDAFGIKGFFNAYIAFAMTQSGNNPSVYNIMDTIPSELFYNFIKDAVKQINDAESGDKVEVKEFANVDFSKGEPGHFIINNPREFFKKNGLGLRVSYNANNKSFTTNVRILGEKKETEYPERVDPNRAVDYSENKKGNRKESRPDDFYQDFNQDEPAFNIPASPELNKALEEMLASLGVSIERVNEIVDSKGNPLTTAGKSNALLKVIHLANGKERIDTLPEETAHMITALLGPNHPLMRQMMDVIDQFPLYEEVKRKYFGVYTEGEMRFEAVGKMIAVHLIKQVPIGNEAAKEYVDNWFTRLLRVLFNMFNKTKKDVANLENQLNIFEEAAQKILSGELARQIKLNSEKGALPNAKEVATAYNMNTSGFMSPNIDINQLKKDLKRNNLTSFDVATTSNGGHYLTRKGQFFNPFRDYFQLTTQAEIENSLAYDKSKLSSDFAVVDEVKRYIWNNTIVGKRVSDLQKELFNKMTQGLSKKVNESHKNEVMREVGTSLHLVMEQVVAQLVETSDNLRLPKGYSYTKIEKTPPHINTTHFKEMRD